MKKSYLAAPILALAVFPLLSGCAERVVYVQRPPVVVSGQPVVGAPPAPPPEVVVGSPGPAYAWVPGYWSWSGSWVWVGGRWVLPPHPGGVWVSGHWVRYPHGYVWIRGYWR